MKYRITFFHHTAVAAVIHCDHGDVELAAMHVAGRWDRALIEPR